MTDRRRLLLLCLLVPTAAAVYLVGNGRVALWDRDEPRYAQTSRQMLDSGDWVVPHYLNLVRTAKPALIYWCQAAAMAAFGRTGDAGAFAARFPSAAATTLLLVLLSAVLWRRLGSQRTLWTVFVFATSGLTIAAAKFCITDAVLLVWVTAAQLCLFAALQGRGTWPVVIVWAVALGLGNLTKGPVILGMQVMTLLALGSIRLWDWWRELEPIRSPYPVASAGTLGYARPGARGRLVTLPSPTPAGWAKVGVAIAVLMAIVLPWVLMVNHRAALPTVNGQSRSFIETIFRHEIWDRMMTPLEQHKAYPGYYLASIWGTFFPWSLLLPLAIGYGWHHRADPRTRFALAAVFGPWVMLEAVQTKLPHYLLPAFPPLAYLVADPLVRCLRGEMPDLTTKPFRVAVCAWAVLVAAAGSATWLAVGHYAPLPYAGMAVLSVAAVGFAGTVLVLFLRRRLTAGAVTLGLGTFALVTIAYTLYLPRADFLRLSPRVAGVLADHGVTGPGQCLMIRYEEPSLAFYQGGTIREPGGLWFNAASDPKLPPWLVLTRPVWDAAPAPLRAEFDVVEDERGLAYADKGTWVDVLVVHRRAR